MTPSANRYLASANEPLIPRFLVAGQVILDRLYRDGRIADRWLRLYPREFELFWRLAAEPGTTISKEQLLSEVWRMTDDPPSNSLAVHVARIRNKLEPFDQDHILVTDGRRGYFLNV